MQTVHTPHQVFEDESSIQVAGIHYSVFPYTIPQEGGLQVHTPNVTNKAQVEQTSPNSQLHAQRSKKDIT